MAEFRMPSLGADMEAGTLVEWKVKPGDAVKRGDLVAVVDTNKGAIEIEIWEEGVVEEIRVAVGAKVPVGTVLAMVRGAGAPAVVPGPAPVPAPAAPVVIPPPSPGPPPTGPGVRVRASPAARARARELGVDPATVRGTGPDGAVTVADVEAAAPAAATPIRQAIAAAMSRSNREIPHYSYTGKDDPVMLVRTQMNFPATGEVLAPYQIGHYVAGGMRGSHNQPLMPVGLNSGTSYFDGPPCVSCAAYSMRGGKLAGPVDAFAHPFWQSVRLRVAEKAVEMRRQGFIRPAMLPMGELEYTGIMEKLAALEKRFVVRPG